MKSVPSLRYLLLAASTIAMLSGAANAASYNFDTPTLYEQTDGSITYVTGGIGENETAELENAKPYYNVHITNAQKNGAFVSDTSVVIQDRKGNDLIATKTGPLLYVNLPAGRYTLFAENSGIVQEKKFTVSAKKPSDFSLMWNLPE